jgi:hypothetical protein
LVPAWDLGIVLKALQLSPFEPLDLISFKFLTYKCCFLLALPSHFKEVGSNFKKKYQVLNFFA